MALRQVDATNAAALLEALQGTSYAVNAVLGSRRTMLAATRNLCAAAECMGLTRIIHISSMAVYGRATGFVDETAPWDSTACGYAGTKIDCETFLREWVVAGRGDAVILRPGLVHGPGGEAWIGRIGRLLCARRLGDLGADGDGFANLCFAPDLGRAAVAALTQPNLSGQILNVAAPNPPRWNALLLDLACRIGAVPFQRVGKIRLRAEALAAPLLHPVQRLSQKLGAPPGTWPEPIPPSLQKLFSHDLRLDSRKAADLLPFMPTDGAKALAASAAWFANQYGAAVA
jgi:nucleoside-diphosphate-sugar epimerase